MRAKYLDAWLATLRCFIRKAPAKEIIRGVRELGKTCRYAKWEERDPGRAFKEPLVVIGGGDAL